jgi:hypothetical protein
VTVDRSAALEKAHEARREQAARDASNRLLEAIEDTGIRYPLCNCDFSGVRGKDQLRHMRGCCDPQYVCPRLDNVRRSAGM